MRSSSPSNQSVSVAGVPSAQAFGTPTIKRSATTAWFAEGFRRAVERLETAVALGTEDASETFIPLFEALNWAYAGKLETSLKRGTPSAEVARGVRFARNRVGHQWADAIELLDTPTASGPVVKGRSGARPPTVVKSWCWRSVAELPNAPKGHEDRVGQRLYTVQLAGKPVLDALRILAVEAVPTKPR
jgi:hypothetical protein